MKHLICIAIMLMTLATFSSEAKDRPQSYNMQRALECVQEYDFDKALEYVKRELSDNPKNAKAYDLLGYLYLRNDENGKAISSLSDALRHYPKKDKTGRARAHYWRSKVYLEMNDTITAIKDLENAVSLQPKDDDYLSELAELYFASNRYDDADVIYNKMIAFDAGNPLPLYGLARNAMNRELYDKAQEYIDRSRLLDRSSTMPDVLEMRLAADLGDDKKVVDKAIRVLENNFRDEEAILYLRVACDSVYDYAINSLRKKVFENKGDAEFWKLLIGIFQQQHKDYPSAIATFEEMLSNSGNNWKVMLYLIDCYEDIEDLEKIESLADTILELDPENGFALVKRADAKLFSGRLDEAKLDYEKAMEVDSHYGGFCYYRLGWVADIQGDHEQALKDYDMSIALDDEYPYVLMMKGTLLIDYLGRPDEGREIMKQVIEMDEIAENGCCLQYAYVALGERDKAIEVMDSIIALNPENPGNYYDAACVYSRLEEKENALKHLRLAFEKGYRKFRHIDQDDDLDFIRDTPEFRALMKEFDKPVEPKVADAKEVETVVYEIPIVRQNGGTYLVKASINELPMEFVLDTGCSDVSLSQVEGDFMLKNGYIKQSDMRGNQRYTDANGDTHTSKTVNLSKVKIGDLEVNNIRAGIVPNQKAPLLLGQEVLSKFGKVEIDHTHSLLKITVVK